MSLLGKSSATDVLSLDEFLGLRGLSSPVSDFMLDKVRFPHGLTLRQRKRLEKDAEKAEIEYSALRKAAIAEYQQLVAEGKIREPSRVEVLMKTANGHEDNPATHAARRVLAKRGIDWQMEKTNAQTVDSIIADAEERSAETAGGDVGKEELCKE